MSGCWQGVWIVLVCFLLLESGRVTCAATATMFYVVAHQDDWQLFMSPTAYYDVRTPNTKVVFIYTTAGDAGHGTGTIGRPLPYYLAREEGALRAVRFVATTGFGSADTSGMSTVHGHTIMTASYMNTVSYFLRLPDGNLHGNGYARTGYQSLQRLLQGAIPQLRSITGDATYVGWSDLVQTLRTIIVSEARGSPIVHVHLADLDAERNPDDHADHLHTTQAVLEAIHDFPCINRTLYAAYVTRHHPVNLSAPESAIEAAVWGVTNSGLIDFSHHTTWNARHNGWLGRNYFRTVAGTGECPF